MSHWPAVEALGNAELTRDKVSLGASGLLNYATVILPPGPGTVLGVSMMAISTWLLWEQKKVDDDERDALRDALARDYEIFKRAKELAKQNKCID